VTIAKKKYDRHQTHGVVHLSVIPVRRLPNDKSEIVTQLLFGETLEVITKKHNNWCRIKSEWDGYEGWVDRKQLLLISKSEFDKLSGRRAYALDICAPVYSDKRNTPILIGSTLPRYDGISLKISNGRMRYSGQIISPEFTSVRLELLRKIAFKYLGAPYLWGGRSPFGIDCSGYVQNVFKFFNIRLPRDAYQQAGEGEVVDFISQSKLGDLAFFANEEGKIIHVGIVLENNEIIHASGEVRIDLIDHMGIYNRQKRDYTHFLRIIKRVILIDSED
jgi:hypothetical protein